MDGDLDLVVNNIDDEASVFRNNSNEFDNANYIIIDLNGDPSNSFGLGTKLTLHSQSGSQHQQMTLSRGFQSSVAPTIHFGLGNDQRIDSLIVEWSDGQRSKLTQLEVNQALTINKKDGITHENIADQSNTWFEDLSNIYDLPVHTENVFDDYIYQVLLPHKMSNWGPALVAGDVNGDGLDDFYFGGASRSSGRLYWQQQDGSFLLKQSFDEDKFQEDIDASFVDIDSDGDMDLYVVSGGNEFPLEAKYYADRLYLNNNGVFEKFDRLPQIVSSGACVKAFDYDNDGDIDLFVGGRLSPLNYPYAGESYILTNHSELGQLTFENHTQSLAPGLTNVGMVTDAIWTDFDQDGMIDLVVVGEWMPISIFLNKGSHWENMTDSLGYKNTTGWWFSIESGDLDNDGDNDLVVGNLGLNYKYQASPNATFDLYAKDFDKNNKSDIVLGYYNDGKQYPVRGRQCSSSQIPAIESNFKNYESFAVASLSEVYGENNLDEATHFQVESFASIVMMNKGGGQYEQNKLSNIAQLSNINDILIRDFDEDGNMDVLVAGNLYASEVETPRSDAGVGLVLKGHGDGSFSTESYNETGLLLNYDFRKFVAIEGDSSYSILAANNQGPLQLFEKSNKHAK